MKSKINAIATSILVLFLTIGTSSYAIDTSKDAEKAAKKEKKIKKQRKAFQKNKSNAIKALYKENPEAQAQIASAYGYAAFGNTGINLFVLSSGNGGGMVHSNVTGQEQYVKMISYGAGVGIGLKKYFAVFIFEDKAAYDNFITSGWSAEGAADATADTGKEGEGGSVGAGMSVADGVILYQMADKGFSVQATIQGTKFVVSDELNGIAK